MQFFSVQWRHYAEWRQPGSGVAVAAKGRMEIELADIRLYDSQVQAVRPGFVTHPLQEFARSRSVNHRDRHADYAGKATRQFAANPMLRGRLRTGQQSQGIGSEATGDVQCKRNCDA